VKLFSVLRALARCASVQTSLARKGGLDVLISGFNRFPNDEDVALQCCGALGNMVVDCLENAIRVNSIGGVEIACRAMELFRTSANVCTQVIFADCCVLHLFNHKV
jgi:hypothetical protein